jgi:hypothetical protein
VSDTGTLVLVAVAFAVGVALGGIVVGGVMQSGRNRDRALIAQLDGHLERVLAPYGVRREFVPGEGLIFVKVIAVFPNPKAGAEQVVKIARSAPTSSRIRPTGRSNWAP